MKAFIVGEISANHGNDINIVKESMKALKDIGADAVKIQTYTPDTITLDCNNKYFQINNGTIWDGRTLYDLYSEAYTPWEWHEELFEYAKEIDIVLFSTPFDNTAVDLLEKLDNPIYKIASFEINDIPLIKYVARLQKPMIISTGIATENEIKEAIEACHEVGNQQVTLLKCTSEYPAKIEDANLSMMADYAHKYKVKVGLSDHTLGDEVAVVATAMGASVIEKHFILNREIGGPDASFSLNVHEFKTLIEKVRRTETIIGKVNYELSDQKKKSRKYARSIFVCKDVEEGQVVSYDNIKIVRPSDGLAPNQIEKVIGKKYKMSIKKGTPLSFKILKG